MLSHPPTLAEQIASMRTPGPAPAWLPESLHALIMAILARLFGRLEDILALWQAGQLPPPAIRRRSPRSRTTPTGDTSRQPRHHTRPRTAAEPRASARPIARAQHQRAQHQRAQHQRAQHLLGHPQSRASATPANPARAPPPTARPRRIRPIAGPHSHAQFVSITQLSATTLASPPTFLYG